VTLHSVFDAALLLAVARHRYPGASLPLRHLVFANLRPYLDPPLSDENLGAYFAMLRFATLMHPRRQLWELAAEINGDVPRAIDAHGIRPVIDSHFPLERLADHGATRVQREHAGHPQSRIRQGRHLDDVIRRDAAEILANLHIHQAQVLDGLLVLGEGSEVEIDDSLPADTRLDIVQVDLLHAADVEGREIRDRLLGGAGGDTDQDQ
jgi:hypothetical protein